MNEILSIEQLRNMSTSIISIPNFDGTGTIDIKVQKPRLMAMASKGQIPNHLMSIVNDMMFGKKKDSSKNQKKEDKVKDVFKIYELNCFACMVEPKYDDVKDILTDDQMEAIFVWANKKVSKLDSFRTNEGNGSSNNNGKTLPEKTQ